MKLRIRFFTGGSLVLAALLVNSATAAETNAVVASTNTPDSTIAVMTNAATVGTNSVAAKPGKPIKPEEAKAHIGETATVVGKVFGVHTTAKGDTFINVGAAHPDAPFSVVVFHDTIPAEKIADLDGKTVSFTGKIKEYKGKPEMVLDAADQFSVLP